MYTIDTSHPSPNHSTRAGAPITLIVLHATVGPYLASRAWLCNPKAQVSTHYLIDRDGHIDQLVPDNLAAWHAGRSQWFDLDSNDIQRQSIGIELVNENTGHDPYPPAQLDAATWLGRSLIDRYHIVKDMVTRHLDIAVPKGRKTDPAGLPWPYFRDNLYAMAKVMRVLGLPVYQQPSLKGPLAGHLESGAFVSIDDTTYPSGARHLVSGLGFVDPNGLGEAS